MKKLLKKLNYSSIYSELTVENEWQYRRKPNYLLEHYKNEEIRQKCRFNRENLQYIIDLVHKSLAQETDGNCELFVSFLTVFLNELQQNTEIVIWEYIGNIFTIEKCYLMYQEVHLGFP